MNGETGSPRSWNFSVYLSDKVRCKSPISLMDWLFNPNCTKRLLPKQAVFPGAGAVSHADFPPAASAQGIPRTAQSSAILPRPTQVLNALPAFLKKKKGKEETKQ